MHSFKKGMSKKNSLSNIFKEQPVSKQLSFKKKVLILFATLDEIFYKTISSF